MRKKIIKTLSLVLAFALCSTFACCGKDPAATDDSYKITLLLNGWTNTPTTDSDPYKAWIKKNYGLNITLNATTDFTNSVMIGFSSANKPNIVSFPSFTSFQSIRNQGVLLEDWTPYLEKMPHFKKLLSSESQSFTKQVLTDGKGRLNAIWTPSSPPTWSLKIREDWADEYRATTVNYDKNGSVTTKSADIYIPAGATVTNGGKWNPSTPQDLLYFARYIKLFKNSGSELDCFGFTTAGGGTSLGTLETWLPLMWGRVSVAPYGFYVNENNEVKFSTTDGTYGPYLNFLRQICDENLIDPNWFSQSFSNDKRTTAGKIGIQWYPGSITSSTQIDANKGKTGSDIVDTTDWWETYPLPVATSDTTDYAGYMAGQGLAGNIITVSKQTSMNTAMMNKICAFIDDCYAYYDEQSKTYERGVAYNALRWGVGVENSIVFKSIENTNLTYCNSAGDEKTYRGKYSGAWDWGAWISSSYDGIIQGTTEDITSTTLKVAEHNLKTATYKTTPQIGEYLTLDSATVNNMALDMASFAYKYVTRQTDTTVEEYCQKWHTTLKGDDMIAECDSEFKELGLVK